MSKYKDQVIDMMNRDPLSCPVVLRPGEVWTPRISVETEEEYNPEKDCNHKWHSVTLFSSTVEECLKCGKLRGEY